VPEEASGLRQPRFWIRVFLLLDRLPAKANEPCLPTHTHTQSDDCSTRPLEWTVVGTLESSKSARRCQESCVDVAYFGQLGRPMTRQAGCIMVLQRNAVYETTS